MYAAQLRVPIGCAASHHGLQKISCVVWSRACEKRIRKTHPQALADCAVHSKLEQRCCAASVQCRKQLCVAESNGNEKEPLPEDLYCDRLENSAEVDLHGFQCRTVPLGAAERSEVPFHRG